jgi:hypothetical protein
MAGKRITKDENRDRVDLCYQFRFIDKKPFKVKEWLDYCSMHYPDKSVQTHTKYWADAGKIYEAEWKEKLNRSLNPAVNELLALMSNEDPKVRQRAVDQIMKYSGHDIIKQEISATVDSVNVKFRGIED